MIALATWAFIDRGENGVDSFVPLRVKNLGATTEKNLECRVKLKLENRSWFYWRHEIGDMLRGDFDFGRTARLPEKRVVQRACFIPGRGRVKTPDCRVSIARRCSDNPAHRTA